MHDKITTAENMLKRNWQCNYNCSLCLCIHETTDHLLTQCNFVEVAWNIIAHQFGLFTFDQMPWSAGPCNWVRKMLQNGSLKEKKKKKTRNIVYLLVGCLERKK
jgi:hypothetical protein